MNGFEPQSRPRIVILGGGFAGLATARRLERKLRPGEADVVLVSRENYQLFTPMLPEVSSGNLELRHIVSPLRAQLKRTQFVLAEITKIDLARRCIEVSHTIAANMSEEIPYTHLVIALGSVTSTFNIPGVAEHALPLKTLEDAESLRNRIIAALETADVTRDPAERKRLLTFTVVGGGYTGCEAVGELVDLFRSIIRYYRSIRYDEIAIYLVEAGKKLLGDLPPKMGAYTFTNLAGRGVKIVMGDGVKALDHDGFTLTSGTRIECATVVWSAGVRPPQIVHELPAEHARNGGLFVDRDLRLRGRTNEWSLGDSAWVPTEKPDSWYPATAQHAIREGPVLADNIIATLRGEPTKPFAYNSLGTMASLGARRGVAQLPGDFILTGFFAWIMWRTYYLSRLPGLDRRLRVTFDWTLGLLFPRDIAEMRVYSAKARRMAAQDAGMKLAEVESDGSRSATA
jgi:NADH dehydrogenase